jgi:hypothetical protein
MALITEFMPNGSLKNYLVKHASSMPQTHLFHFARSAAAGMLHLSSMTPPVLHRAWSERFSFFFLNTVPQAISLHETSFSARWTAKVGQWFGWQTLALQEHQQAVFTTLQ